MEKERVNAMKKMKSIERHRYENSHYADDDDNSKFLSSLFKQYLNSKSFLFHLQLSSRTLLACAWMSQMNKQLNYF